MNKQRCHPFSILELVGRAFPEMVALLAWGFLGFTVASAQDWQIGSSRTAGTEPAKKLEDIIGLRPNVEDRVYLWIKNAADNGKIEKKVTVRLYQLDRDGKTVLEPQLPKSILKDVPPDKWVLVSFAPEEDAKPGEPKVKKDKVAVAPIPMIPLATPPLKLRVAILSERKEVTKDFSINILEPHELVKVEEIKFKLEKDGSNLLSVKVKALKPLTPPPVVELVLLPELIPGLLTPEKDITINKTGSYRRELEGVEPVLLIAKNLKFEKKLPPKSGTIYLTVDGYQRAFVLPANLSSDFKAPPAPNKTAALRIVPRKVFSKPVDKLPLRLEADNYGLLDKVYLQVDLDRTNSQQYEEVAKLPTGAREQRVSVGNADPGGALVFKAEVKDWVIELDTKEIYGQASVRVKMIEIKDKKEKAEAEADLVFDNTPPQDVKFVVAGPRKLMQGKPLPVKATAIDPESGIVQAVFFLGKPLVNKDGQKQLPPGETAEVKLSPKAGEKTLVTATADLPLPADSKGEMYVSVMFVNGAQQKEFKTIQIEWLPPGTLDKDGNAGKKSFKIEGKVLQGDSPQPNLVVQLKDEKGVVKATTRTADGKDKNKARGTFVFANVPPGVYTITAANSASRTKGQTMTTVETDNVSGVEIRLLR